MPPDAGGEGMTGSRYRLPTAGAPALMSASTAYRTTFREHTTPVFPTLHSMRCPAPASRPFGRYAVGLRPGLDPDASVQRGHNLAEKTKNKVSDLLTGPAPSGMTCCCPLRLSRPGQSGDPGTSFRVPPGCPGNTTKRLTAHHPQRGLSLANRSTTALTALAVHGLPGTLRRLL